MMRRDHKKIWVMAWLSLLLGLGAFTAASAEAAAGNVQTFVTFKYIDPMSRMEAFRLLIPKGWKAEGGVQWSSNPALPVQSRFRFFNPGGTEEFNLFPTQTYFWTDNRIFLTTNPPGSLRFGSRVAQPFSLHQAFTGVIISGARKNVGGLKIVLEKSVPELAKLARGEAVQGVRSSAEGGKMRIAYRENGRLMEEEIYAAVSQFVIKLPASGGGSYFINYWFVDDVFSFRAEQGRLDGHAKLFQTMLYSLKVNPQWYAKVVNVKEMLAQQNIRQIKAIGRIGEMVARAGSQMREEQMRDWERRQQVNDRIARNFSDNIRGVDRYYDARAGKEVELPAGYGHAWANNLGEYIVTESPSYNPNIGSNRHWEELSPAR